MHRGRARGRIAGWCLVVFALLAGAELSARAYLLLRGFPASRYTRTNEALREARAVASSGFDTDYPYLPFRPAPGRDQGLPVDSLGFLGPETGWAPPPGTLRVLCMGGSMVYDGGFPASLDACLDSLLAAGDRGFDSCQVITASGPTWTSAENLVYYAIRGVQTSPAAIVVYVAVNDVYAMFRPDSTVAEPDYSHYRGRWMAVSPAPWDRIPGWADSSRAVALARFALDRMFYQRFQHSLPHRLGLRYEFYPQQTLDTTFGSYENNLEAITAIAQSRGTAVFLVSELQDPTRSSSEEMALAVEALNATAGRVASRHAAGGLVHFVDAASLIAPDSTVLSDKSHLTPLGSDLLGRLVAQAVFESLPATPSGPSRGARQ